MRTLPCWALLGVFAACGADIAPGAAAAPSAAAEVTPPPAPAAAASARAEAASGPASSPCPDRARTAADTATAVGDLLARAAAGDAVSIGQAPAAILALGDGALPGLVQGLAHADVLQRRIAALTLLQWSTALPADRSAVVDALGRARDDPDPAVRAAAEIAFRRATGDSAALDQSRAAHDAALRSVR